MNTFLWYLFLELKYCDYTFEGMAESPRGGIPLGEVAAVPVMNPWERLNIIACWVKTAPVPNKEKRRNDAQRQLIRRNWSAFSQRSVRDLALKAVIVDKRLQPEEPPLRSNPIARTRTNFSYHLLLLAALFYACVVSAFVCHVLLVRFHVCVRSPSIVYLVHAPCYAGP